MLSSDGGGVAGEGARLVSTERDLELGSPLPTRDTTPASQLLYYHSSNTSILFCVVLFGILLDLTKQK